jgi:hypothetical protein
VSEPPTNNPTLRNDALDLLGRCVGGDIKIFGTFSQEEVSNRASYKVGRESSRLKHTIKLEGVRVDNGFVDHICPYDPAGRGADAAQREGGAKLPEITSDLSSVAPV